MMRSKRTVKYELGSFRDPSGYVYYHGESVFRHVNPSYKPHLDRLLSSGLLETLTHKNLLLPFSLVTSLHSTGAIATFKTTKLPFISYPYEWSFSQLKDAALLTLSIQKEALEAGMTLKDASAYNVQFLNNRPIFIDLLSFEKYEEGTPWTAYKQFCQHFLGPLLLMSQVDVRLQQLLKIYIDGVPLDLVSSLLPKRTYLSLGISSHIHFHARNQQTFADSGQKKQPLKMKLSKISLLGIIDNLETMIQRLTLKNKSSEWGEYYSFTNYDDSSFQHKKAGVKSFLKKVKPKTVWDIGANNGEFSRLVSQMGAFTVSSDIDPLAVEKNYLRAKEHTEQNLLPLLIDLTNPSPALGWNNQERQSFIGRGPVDLVMALALIHHLAISNNVPFSHIARFCSKLGTYLVIEFVPKSDSQVQKLLATRKDVFPDYTQHAFETEFEKEFSLIKKQTIKKSQRILYLLKRK